jgi:hypothetical protein
MLTAVLTTAEVERRRKALFRATIASQLEETRKEMRREALRNKKPAGVKLSGMIQDELIRRKSVNSCIVKATGEPKKQMTKDDAVFASYQMTKRHGGCFYHYECIHCGHWHVGKRKTI